MPDTFEKIDFEKKLKHFDIFHSEANAVREQDKILIRSLFKNFSQKKLTVGIGFQRAYGSMLSGDYFDLVKLPDDQFMFVFADVSGHGLPAYTTLIRLRSSITLAVKEAKKISAAASRELDTAALVNDIAVKFTDIMDESNSTDFACIIFAFISRIDDQYILKLYNRSMLFPIIIKPAQGNIDIINLNYSSQGWEPKRGFYLGSDMHELLGDSYFNVPECVYTINKGDSVFFYSDGISEACSLNDTEEFGDRRIEDVLMDYAGLFPQVVVDELFRNVYSFIGTPEAQKDDMTAVLIGFPSGNKK